MNGTLINETDLINIKHWVSKIEGLENLKVFTNLTFEENRKLEKTKKKLFKLIKNL